MDKSMSEAVDKGFTHKLNMSYGEDLWSLMGQLLTAQYMRKALNIILGIGI